MCKYVYIFSLSLFPNITSQFVLFIEVYPSNIGIQPMNEHSVIFKGLVSENIYIKPANYYNQKMFFPVNFPSTNSGQHLATYNLERQWGYPLVN